ncbi:MAG: hypothetical protein GXX79_02460, partial [Actinomycetales bacterium]|nr:hypothetical protein [Actinomycetales bacterium]
ISGSWIHDVSYVLDTSTGQYRRVPFRVLLSPDGTQAVVSSGTDVGLVSRSALLRDGGAAVRWTGLRYRERGPAWSPDGRAVLIGWDDDSRDFTVQRYDLATGRTTTKRLRLDGPTTPQKSSITWADDSQAYLVYRHPTDSHEPAVVECVEPDGTVIVRWETSTTPGAIGGRGMPGTGQRSPSGRLVIIDASTWKSTSTVIDMSSGRIVDWLPAGVRPVGFLDEGTVAWLAPTWGYLDWKEKAVLVIADLSTDRVLRELEVPHPPTMTVTAVQLGSTEGLTGHAAARGFS